MLAAVLTMFLVFTLSGVAVLNIASYSTLESQDAVQGLKNQYAVESAVNVAMWRLNMGADSLANFTDGPVTASYDSTGKELTVSIDRYDKPYSVDIYLGEDHHFNHIISAKDSIDLGGHIINSETEPRDFPFMLDVDLDYFMDNADQIHNNVWKSWDHATFTGIHVFTGNWLWLEDINVEGTLVFTGRFIWFLGHNTITSQADSVSADPALVFTNKRQNVWLNNDDITGAIYAAGRIILSGGGDISGPIVGRVVEIDHDFSFLDHNHRHHYKWTRGFGNYDNYDWPKNIGRWRAHYHDD